MSSQALHFGALRCLTYKLIGTTNFNMMKEFLSRLVSKLDIDSGNTRVGLVTFSSDVGTSINLNDHSSVASLQSAISALNLHLVHYGDYGVHLKLLTSFNSGETGDSD